MEKVENTKVTPQVNEKKATNDAAKDAEFKAKKAAAAKAFSERQAALKKERAEAVKALQDFAAKNKVELPKIVQDWIVKETAVRTGGGFGGVSLLNKVFGDTPKVGDSITVLAYMQKTMKGKDVLDKKIKEWAEKGIVVEYTDNADKLKATYTIKKLA